MVFGLLLHIVLNISLKLCTTWWWPPLWPKHVVVSYLTPYSYIIIIIQLFLTTLSTLYTLRTSFCATTSFWNVTLEIWYRDRHLKRKCRFDDELWAHERIIVNKSSRKRVRGQWVANFAQDRGQWWVIWERDSEHTVSFKKGENFLTKTLLASSRENLLHDFN